MVLTEIIKVFMIISLGNFLTYFDKDVKENFTKSMAYILAFLIGFLMFVLTKFNAFSFFFWNLFQSRMRTIFILLIYKKVNIFLTSLY